MKTLLQKLIALCAVCLVTLSAAAGGHPNYLCFTAGEGGATIKLSKVGSPTTVTIQYQKNGITDSGWTAVDFETATTTGDIITLAANDFVYFRNASNVVTGFSNGTDNYYYFVMTGSIAASGNVMSLVDRNCATTTIPCTNCFNFLFKDCTALTTAPVLPAETLTNYCYQGMFQGCTSLAAAPELSAKTLVDRCYQGMFKDCISLATAPALPATSLAGNCYNSMFSGCTALLTAPELSVKTLMNFCYQEMFRGCTSLTTAPELPATDLAPACYYGMFQDCTSLETAPELPATTLKNYCYAQMFYGCSKLNYVKVGFTDWQPTDATSSWLSGVASTGTFVCPVELGKVTRDISHIPSGWLVIGYDLTVYLTVSSVGWASMYLPFNVTIPTDVDVYYASAASGNAVTLTPITGTIPAETAVIVRAAAGTITFPYTTSTDATPITGNLFEGSSVAKSRTEDVYVLSGASESGNPQFKNYTGDTLGAHKIWLPKSNVPGAGSAIQFRFDDATAITTVPMESSDGALYNLAGQRVGSDYRGLVIQNGKKMWNN